MYAVYLNDRDIETSSKDLDAQLNDLKTDIELHLMNLDGMDALLRSGDPQNVVDLYFFEYSEVIAETTPGMIGIIVVNDTGTLFAYPGGLEVYTNQWQMIANSIPEVSSGLEEMMTHGEGSLMGPFVFNDGSTYMVAGEPVFHANVLWGFQALIFNLTYLFGENGFLEDDLDFNVQFINQDGKTFFGNDLSGRDDLMVRKMEIRNVEWEVLAYYTEGWSQETTISVILLLSGEIVITSMIIVVVFILLRYQVRLSSVVQLRTSELEDRSRNLTMEIDKRKRSQKDLAKANKDLEESLKEVNSLLKLSRLHLEGQEGLDEVFGKAVKIIEMNLLDPRDQCACIRFDRKNYMVKCQPSNEILYVSRIYLSGKERGAIEIRCLNGDQTSMKCNISKREKRIIDSISSQLGAIAERWFTQQMEMEARNRAHFYLDLMSHDINNMHQGILINLEMMRLGLIQGDKKKDSINTSMDLIRRSIKLVSNVKLLSYLKGLKEPLKPIEINESLFESAKEVKASFAGREVEITTDMSADQMYVLGDRLVGEVFVNIMHNGIKVQNGDPARLKIEVVPTKDTIRVSISDHGPGIRDTDKGTLFERHTGKKNDRLLSGIGLSLVKVLMDRYRGRVWIEDRVRGRSDQGAKFVLEFQKAN